MVSLMSNLEIGFSPALYQAGNMFDGGSIVATYKRIVVSESNNNILKEMLHINEDELDNFQKFLARTCI